MARAALTFAIVLAFAGCFDAQDQSPPAGTAGPEGDASVVARPAEVTPDPQPVPDPTQEAIRAADLTRRMLTTEQIRLAPPASEWVSLRIYVSDEVLTGETTHFAFVSEPAEGAMPFLALAVFVPSTDPDVPSPPPVVVPLALPSVAHTAVVTVQRGAQGEGQQPPPDSPIGVPELMVLYGTTHGDATLHFGIVADVADLEATRADVRGRPLVNIAPDHGGEHGFAGSFIHTTATNGARSDIEAGNLAVTYEATLEGPGGTVVGRHLKVDGQADLPVDGIGAILYSEPQAAVAGDWGYDWRLGNASGSDSGSGPMTSLPVPSTAATLLGLRPPTSLYQGPVAAGPAHLAIERTFSGKEDVGEVPVEGLPASIANGVLVTWGYVGADLAAMYGWSTGSYGTAIAAGGALS